MTATAEPSASLTEGVVEVLLVDNHSKRGRDETAFRRVHARARLPWRECAGGFRTAEDLHEGRWYSRFFARPVPQELDRGTVIETEPGARRPEEQSVSGRGRQGSRHRGAAPLARGGA